MGLTVTTCRAVYSRFRAYALGCVFSSCHRRYRHSHRQNRGTCLFQQCGGVVVAGNARGYQSYFYNRPDRPERITRGTPATRPPLPSTVPPTRPPLPSANTETRPVSVTSSNAASGPSPVAVSGSGATKPGMPPGSVAAIVVSILVVAGLAVGGVIVYLKVIKKSSDTSEGLVGS